MTLAPQPEDPRDDSIGDLFHQLVDEGSKVVQAEIGLYKEIARHRAAKARNGLIALAVGATLIWDALIVLLLMLAQGLAIQIGPIASGLIVAAAVTLPAVFLIRFGIARVTALAGDDEEREALHAAEQRT